MAGRPAVFALLLAGLAIAAASGAERDPPLDMGQAKTVMQRLDGDAAVQAIFGLCPADAYRRDAPFYADYVKPDSVPLARCAAGPADCYRRCVDEAEPGACFGLARAFQVTEPAIDHRYAQMLFALACDHGEGAGCTNRASSLRNAPVKGDAARFGDATARQDCEVRSFRAACTQGDAWGCTMLGQSYQNGEGVERSVTQARRYYEKSCAINARFASCDFAKANMESLGTGR